MQHPTPLLSPFPHACTSLPASCHRRPTAVYWLVGTRVARSTRLTLGRARLSATRQRDVVSPSCIISLASSPTSHSPQVSPSCIGCRLAFLWGGLDCCGQASRAFDHDEPEHFCLLSLGAQARRLSLPRTLPSSTPAPMPYAAGAMLVARPVSAKPPPLELRRTRPELSTTSTKVVSTIAVLSPSGTGPTWSRGSDRTHLRKEKGRSLSEAMMFAQT